MMNNKINLHKIFDAKLIKFGFVGILNTIFSAIIMLLLYNLVEFNYWGASAIAYIMGSILSFILNRNYTFKSKTPILIAGMKFTLNIAICYLVSYSLAKPIMKSILIQTQLKAKTIEQISMLLGMVLFTIFNYFGQRFFAFKEKQIK